MDYEKKYKEALERAKLSRLQLLDIGEEATEIEHIFPELKESEDERIRKELIDFFSDSPDSDTFRGIPPSKIIAWLEKQGEIKETADKDFNKIITQLKTSIVQCKGFNKENTQKTLDLIDSLKQIFYRKSSQMVKRALD